MSNSVSMSVCNVAAPWTIVSAQLHRGQPTNNAPRDMQHATCLEQKAKAQLVTETAVKQYLVPLGFIELGSANRHVVDNLL